jgi:hypothetical protein
VAGEPGAAQRQDDSEGRRKKRRHGLQLTDNPGRIARRDNIRWNITGYHATRPDNRSFSDPGAFQDD